MGPVRAQLAGEAGGVSLPELIATMGLGLLIGAAALMGIEGTRSSSLKTNARQEAVSEAEHAVARMTREIHQATQAAVVSATRIDVKTRVRNSSNNTLQLRRISFECFPGSTQECRRTDCGATSANGSLIPASCSSGQLSTMIDGVVQAQIVAEDDGVTQSLPRETPNVDFVTIRLQVRLDDFTSGRQSVRNLDPIELTDGVEFANLDN
jgi:hypothetical protein